MRLKSGSLESRRLVFVGQETTSRVRTWEVGKEKIVRNGRWGRDNDRADQPHSLTITTFTPFS